MVASCSLREPGLLGRATRHFSMRKKTRSWVLRYSVAVLAVIAATVGTLFIPWLKQRETFVLLMGAVALSSWYGGRAPGIAACFLGAMLQNYFILEPVYEFSLAPEALIPMTFFLVVALMISYLTTSLVEAGEESREQRQLSDVTLSSIGDAVISTDFNGRIKLMNAVAQALTGWSAAEAEGKTSGEVLCIEAAGENAAQAGSLRDDLQAGGVHHNPVEEVFRRKVAVNSSGGLLRSRSGRKIPIEGNAAPIKDAQGSVQGVVFVFRDITEREAARDKILEYQQRLRSTTAEVSMAAERERHTIALGLHDRVGVSLGLTRIKLGQLRAHFSDPEIARQFDDITQLMKQIIAEIRSLTFELSPPILYEFGLEPALEWLALNMQGQHQVKCTFQTTGDGKALSQEYNVLLFQGARELLVNVVKHAHAKEVKVELVKEPERVKVQVRDDGIGFDASQAMLTPEKTLGFGLFSVRERINLLGGTFTIESQAGHGTCVTLSLPNGA